MFLRSCYLLLTRRVGELACTGHAGPFLSALADAGWCGTAGVGVLPWLRGRVMAETISQRLLSWPSWYSNYIDEAVHWL